MTVNIFTITLMHPLHAYIAFLIRNINVHEGLSAPEAASKLEAAMASDQLAVTAAASQQAADAAAAEEAAVMQKRQQRRNVKAGKMKIVTSY